VLALVLAGCYQPATATGVPCSDLDRACPGDQVCIAGTCEPAGTLPVDGHGIDTPPVLLDAPDFDAAVLPPDAAPDAPPSVWSTPTKVPGVNSTAQDDDPSFTPDRLTIVFMSNRNGSEDLFLGTRTTTAQPFTVTLLATVSDPVANDSSPELSADGTTLVFISTRGPDRDVYTSHLVAGVWTTPVRDNQLSATGTADLDVCISPDGLTAIVARSGKLFRATRATTADLFNTPIQIATQFGTNPAAPSLTATGDLYFHADTVRNLYVSRLVGATYQPPVAITELDTTAQRESGPFVAADEHHLMFSQSDEILESTR
jgi:hypothetical protein